VANLLRCLCICFTAQSVPDVGAAAPPPKTIPVDNFAIHPLVDKRSPNKSAKSPPGRLTKRLRDNKHRAMHQLRCCFRIKDASLGCMATASLTELNQNVSAVCRMADQEDVVITRYDRPIYRLSRIRQSDSIDGLVESRVLVPPKSGWGGDLEERFIAGRAGEARSAEILTDMRSR